MKVFILLGLCCAVFATPIEQVRRDEYQPRFAMVPDTDGRMFLADLRAEAVEPSFNADNDVFFLLFTRQNPTAGQRIGLDTSAIAGSNFAASRPTRFIVHGWNNNGGSQVNVEITSAYLRQGDYNVIVVDWGAGANTVSLHILT